MKDIKLANGEFAMYKSTRYALIRDINPDEETAIHYYTVPCPVCHERKKNSAYSYDGVFFINTQVTCKNCGVFFRPMIHQDEIPKTTGPAVAKPGENPGPKFTQEQIEAHQKQQAESEQG